MKIRQLYIFKTVCEEESITKAADHLSMTQPAISRTISELEASLGTPLFERASRKVFLNETGRLLLSKTIPLLELYEDLEESSKALEKLATLRIGASTNISSYSLPFIMRDFKLECADTPTTVTISSGSEIETMLIHNQLDIALLDGIVPNEDLEKIPFSDYPLAVLCSPKHHLAGSESISVLQLSNEPLLLLEKGNAIRDTFDSAMLLENISASPQWTSTNADALIHAAMQNLGITVLPRVIVEDYLNSNKLAELNVDNIRLSCVNHVVFKKDKFQTVAFQSFMNLVLFSEMNKFHSGS